MKRGIVIVVLVIFVVFASILHKSFQEKGCTFRADGYGFGSRGYEEIKALTGKQGDFFIICHPSEHFTMGATPGFYSRSEVIKNINSLQSKRLAVLTLSKGFMTKPKSELSLIAKKKAEWLQSVGFDRVFIEGATGGSVLILLLDTEYERYPERELRNAHDIIEKAPFSIGVDF